MPPSIRDASPDPLTMPSSPLQPHSARRRGRTEELVKPINLRETPSRSMVIDTPSKEGASPWRIRVTVEAEPKDGPPGEMITRTSTVPLNRLQDSSSPSKAGGEIRRPGRKRKGTPIKRQPPRHPPQPEPEQTSEEDDVLPPLPPGSPKPRSSRPTRINSRVASSTRTNRLRKAREELNNALEDAKRGFTQAPRSDAAGDVTVSANEDFSMISVDSLQNAKDNSMSHILNTIPESDKSTASVSHFNSTTQLVQYPNISKEALKARTSLSATTFEQIRADQEREDVVEDQVEDGSNVGEDMEEDVWQEEGSRRIAENENQTLLDREVVQQTTVSVKMEDVFGETSGRPMRSKIPRTWRRSSGMDFSYADSPAHEEVEQRKQSDTDGSGVLTPPSTDEENDEVQQDDEANVADEDEQGSSELTQPDDEATRFQDHEKLGEDDFEEDDMNSFIAQDDVASPFSDASEGATSPEGEDSGSFFVNNMPSVYRHERPRPRPPRQTTVDLADLLNLDGSSPAKPSVLASTATPGDTKLKQQRYSGLKLRPIHESAGIGSLDYSSKKIVSSPLRKSLLKSSKIRGSPRRAASGHAVADVHSEKASPNMPQQVATSFDELGSEPSFPSRASDQRQLLREINANTPGRVQPRSGQKNTRLLDYELARHHAASSNDVGEEDMESCGEGDDMEEEEPDEHTPTFEEESSGPVRSYEEELNLDSPQKVTVNFNDSQSISAAAFQHKKYPSLFDQPETGPQHGEETSEVTESPPMVTLVAKKCSVPLSTQPGIFSRLTTSFWSSIMRPTGPTEVLPQPVTTVIFPAELRTTIRNRYGLCCEEFPWTMYHMRTLHRMLNSLVSQREDSSIPNAGPLPSQLEILVGKQQMSVSGWPFVFTKEHGYVVFSMLQVLVPANLINAMRRGEIEWLGDPMAERFRGYFDSRHGDEPVRFKQGTVTWPDTLRGRIGLDFVVRALGDVVLANLLYPDPSVEAKTTPAAEDISR